MLKNKGKGGKNLKRRKNGADYRKREFVFKEDGQEYAQVLRMLGNCRLEAMCIDGVKRLCHIRGKMHKKVWISAGDIILVGLRDYQDNKADVILRYFAYEARLLKACRELPENTTINAGIDEEDDGGGYDYIEFENPETSFGGLKCWKRRMSVGFFKEETRYHQDKQHYLCSASVVDAY